MITRIVAVDPNPPDKTNDILVYQVPENSRAFFILTDLLNAAKIEWVSLEGVKPSGKKQLTPCFGCGRVYHRGVKARECLVYRNTKGILNDAR